MNLNLIIQLLRQLKRKRKPKPNYKPRPGWWYVTPQGKTLRVSLVDEDAQIVICRPDGRQFYTRVPLIDFATDKFKRLGSSV